MELRLSGQMWFLVCRSAWRVELLSLWWIEPSFVDQCAYIKRYVFARSAKISCKGTDRFLGITNISSV
jgi:hypothetical protein